MKGFLALLALTTTLNTFAGTVTFMQYNVENFFDTTHDEGKEDYTYLPLATKNAIPNITEICGKASNEFYVKECLNTDWNETKLNTHIVNISKMIKSFDNTGKGPDVLVMEEIENLNAVNMLVNKGLTGLGYQTKVLIEGDDERGIDVAVISKYPVTASKRYPLVVAGKTIGTRGILEVELNVNGKKVVVYANHWPSQSNPTEYRVASGILLAKLAAQKKADIILAMGDFNTLKGETPAPFAALANFIDAEAEARKLKIPLNPGSHFYRGAWSSLDHIFVYKNSTMKPNYSRFQIMNRDFAMKIDHKTGQMVPNRSNVDFGGGFSDHLPLALEVNY